MNRSSPFLIKLFALAWLAINITACITVPSTAERIAYANKQASIAHWHRTTISTAQFDLAAYIPNVLTPQPTLTIYIEGDGLAWITASQISSDPTPSHPIALQLALQHPNGNAAYLARPCQFIETENKRHCTQNMWTNARFSQNVVDATNAAVNTLKSQMGAVNIVLVGYSGGGAIAALVAANRNDVTKLITVAGNLDTDAWTHYHTLSPLTGSLNPAHFINKLSSVSQIHFAGELDTVIPPELTRNFIEQFDRNHRPQFRIIPQFDHTCCWVESWRELMSHSLTE